jgi:hypothetical protein
VEEIRTSIDIGASAEAVWDILTDFAGYSSWNPVIPRMKAEPRPGGRVDFTIVIGRMRVPIAARMLRFDSGRELAWTGPRLAALGAIVRGEHYFRIEPSGEGRVRLVHGERFTGLLLPLLWARMKPGIEQAYGDMNRALARRVENTSRNRPNAAAG